MDTTGLSPGDYYGQVRVESPQADNSPQFVSVALSVLPPGSDPGPVVRPTGLIFASIQDGPAPASPDFLVSNLGASPAAFVSRAVTFDRLDWFSIGPEAATVIPGVAGRVIVQAETKGFPAGVRRDGLTLLFSDGKIRNVSVVLLVVPGSGARSAARAADGCAATELVPVFTSLNADFLAPARWPAPVEVRIFDNCGAPMTGPMTGGTVVAAFSNGDPPIALSRLGDGRWSGTWQARNAAAGAVTVTVNAEIPEFRIRGTVSITGSLRSNDTAPVIQPGRIVSAASLASETPLAPGSLISIFGSGLAASPSRSDSLPLPSELRGAQALIAGLPLPLSSVSPERIDAMIPYDLPVNTRHQILVRNGNALGVPETVTLAAAQPAIFTKDQSGAGQGAILAANGRLAEPGNAAAASERIVISCAGLGQVSLPVAARFASPENAAAVNAVTVAIGANALVSFAGLISESAGMYQVIATVPQGAQAGDRVEVRLTAAGQTSPPVTMALR